MMEVSIDIKNLKPRKVICISVQREVYGGLGGEKLTLSQVYNVTHIEKSSWFTRVYLEEFPDECFNSILFGEFDEANTLVDE